MKTRLNLLPWKCRRAEMLRSRLRVWAAVWAAAAAAVAALAWVEAERRRAAADALAEIVEEEAPLAAMRSENRRLKESLDVWGKREAALARLTEPHPPLTLLGMIARGAAACEGQLRVNQLTLKVSEPAAPAEEKKTPPAKNAEDGKADAKNEAPRPASLATVQGTALDNVTVARFVLALRQTGAFNRVELKSAVEQPVGGSRMCSYLVECAY